MQLITNYGPTAVCVLALDVRHERQWCDFHARCNFGSYEDGKPKHSAAWTAWSSFGLFGHFWDGMGEPFDKFIATCSADYVLGKIGKKIRSEKVMLRSVKRAIFTSRATKEQKSEAAEHLKRLADHYDGESLATALYEDLAISKCVADWCDLSTLDWEPSAVHFVKRLWPAIVAEVGRKMDEWRAQTMASAG